MKVINQSFEILTDIEEIKRIPQMIERAARTCYKSEDKITEGSAVELCKKLIKRNHEAILEFGNIQVRFITDRGVTHELVRHRVGTSFAQESTRYVNYREGVTFIRPVFEWARSITDIKNTGIYTSKNSTADTWLDVCGYSEMGYRNMVNFGGCSPQEARSVLPNSLKTEIVVSANIREWRHIFKLRTAKAAHPQIRELMLSLYYTLNSYIPVLFEDLEVKEDPLLFK